MQLQNTIVLKTTAPIFMVFTMEQVRIEESIPKLLLKFQGVLMKKETQNN